ARPRLVSGGAVDDDLALTPRAGDGVGGEALAVGAVVDFDPLPGNEVRRFHEQGIDGDRSLVVEVGVRHRGAVNLRFEKRPLHGYGFSSTVSRRLSINRVPSTRTARGSTSWPARSSTGWKVSASTTSAYSTRARGSAPSTSRRRCRTALAQRSPAEIG